MAMIVEYNVTIMSSADSTAHRVKVYREAHGWSQADLAERAGISRSGISAIESRRLSPSVEAALQLAAVLECSVEELFGQRSTPQAAWAWLPSHFPCRYWVAEVDGKLLAYPVELPTAATRLADGVAQDARLESRRSDSAQRTLVIATCDPAAQFFVELYERQSPFRLLVLCRPSGESLKLLEQGLVHAAGMHLSRVGEDHGNAALLSGRTSRQDLQLLHVAQWEEGLAVDAGSAVKSLQQAKKESLRWIGRLPGAGARRYQDEILENRRPPARIGRDHRAVAEAIRNQWADAGICTRLASEDANLRFLSICEDQYDLCFSQRMAADPRLTALVQTVRSAEYRELIAQLPGYRAADAGEVEEVPVSS